MSPSVEPFNEVKYKALMDGLKCKEILLSDTFTATDYFRLEAEYYNSKSVTYHSTLKHCLIRTTTPTKRFLSKRISIVCVLP